MKSYTIRRTKPETARIECYPWDESGYCPLAKARVSWDEQGLLVQMAAQEQTVIAKETRIGGAVCKDSCLEFFFQPCPDTDPRYINCEVNAGGVMHLGIGAGRGARQVLTELPSDMDVVASIKPGESWSVRYWLPASLIRRWFPAFTLTPGHVLRGNFYACDESIHPHFGCWAPVQTPQPDFHTPAFFGALIIE